MVTNTFRYWYAEATVATAKTVMITQPQTGEKTRIYQDAFGRTVATRSRSFDGGFTITLINYDELGRKVGVAKPAPEWGKFSTATHYDAIGRVDYVTDDLGVLDDTGTPRWGKLTTTYQGSTIMTEPKLGDDEHQQPRWETKNAIGKVTTVEDAGRTKLFYVYDADGNRTSAIPMVTTFPRFTPSTTHAGGRRPQ